MKKRMTRKTAIDHIKIIALGLMLIALLVSYLLGYTPLYLPLIYLLFSVVTYLLYAKDKWAAKRGKWRVKENTLHFAAFVGGWPGAIVAQESLRHKTQKKTFKHVFWLTVVFNFAAFAFLHSPKGSYLIHDITRKIEYIIVNSVDNKTVVAIVVYLTEFRALL